MLACPCPTSPPGRAPSQSAARAASQTLAPSSPAPAAKACLSCCAPCKVSHALMHPLYMAFLPFIEACAPHHRPKKLQPHMRLRHHISTTPSAEPRLLAKKRAHLLYSLQELALRRVALAHGLVQGLRASAGSSVHCYLSRHAMLLRDILSPPCSNAAVSQPPQQPHYLTLLKAVSLVVRPPTRAAAGLAVARFQTYTTRLSPHGALWCH